MKRSTAATLSALLILCVMAPCAGAVSLSGRASTQALWFSDENETDHLDLAQYARVNVRQIDAADTWRLEGYGRATGDTREGDGVDARLYYLYLDKKGLPGRTNVRLGRQYFFTSAGSALVDGARVETSPLGPLTLTVAGGRNVLFSTTGELTRPGDMAGAAQLSLNSIPGGSLNVSYLTTYDQSDLSTEKIGLAYEQRLGKYGEIYTQNRFDLLSRVWNEIEFGARTSIVPHLNLTAEYFRSIPTFEATSIFSVFAVERYQEAALKAEYELLKNLAVEGEYRNESYGAGETANVGEAGLRYRPTDASQLYASGSWRNGAGGHLAGFELSGDMAFGGKYLVSAGLQHDVYQRDLMTGQESASRFWVGGDAKINKTFSVNGRVEDSVNENFSHDVKVRLALNVDF